MKTILHLALEVNSTTIIPNFGAFMKMGKSILFNEFLKYDDGKLAKFISEHKNISTEEAKSLIEDWVSDTNAKLESGDTIDFDNLGQLSKDNGKIKFTLMAQGGEVNVAEKSIEKAEVEVIPDIPIIKEPTKTEFIAPIIENKIEGDKTEKVTKKVTKPINISTDFSAQDAIEKIKSFDNKGDLIAFTREDKRKTVIDALNKKLDALNGKQVITIDSKIENEVNLPEEKNEIVPIEPIAEKEIIPEVIPEENEVAPVVIPLEKKEIVEPSMLQEPEVVVPKKEEPKVQEVKIDPLETGDKVEVEDKKIIASDDKAIAAIVESVDKTEKQLKKRKRRRLILWLSILCFLIGGGLLAYLKLDLIKSYFKKEHEPKELADNTKKNKEEATKETNETTTENSNNDVIVADVATVPEVIDEVEVPEPIIPEVEEVEEVTNIVAPSSGKYHVVAGSFSTEENANNKVESLKSKGYSDAKVLGKFNGLFTVRAMSFDSQSAASEALEKFKSEGNKGFVKKI